MLPRASIPAVANFALSRLMHAMSNRCCHLCTPLRSWPVGRRLRVLSHVRVSAGTDLPGWPEAVWVVHYDRPVRLLLDLFNAGTSRAENAVEQASARRRGNTWWSSCALSSSKNGG